MASGTRALIVAASVGAVEALKDQGFCRWNYTIRSIYHHGKNKLRPFSQASENTSRNSSSSAAAAAVSNKARRGERANRTEECWRKVMDLDCWGPK